LLGREAQAFLDETQVVVLRRLDLTTQGLSNGGLISS
jgi:hypothetical protein